MIRFALSILVLLVIGSPAFAIGGRSVSVQKTVVRGRQQVVVQKVVAAPVVQQVRVQQVRVHGVQQVIAQPIYAQPLVQQVVVPQYAPQQVQAVQAGCSCLFR